MSGNLLKVQPIRNGTVIDHIEAGRGRKILDILELGNSGTTISLLINVQSKKQKRKDIIKVEDRELDEHEIEKLALLSPSARVNLIRNYAVAEKMKIDIYRLDVSAAFEGMIQKLWSLENTFDKKMGRRYFCGESLVSGGFMGRNNEIVVDNVRDPKIVYGIANGNGDFVRELSKQQVGRLKKFSNSALDKGERHLG